jgi:uncharacterized protein (TIGR02391 family)
MLACELVQGIDGLITEIEDLHNRRDPTNRSREGLDEWYRDRQKKARAMMRTLGMLRPYIERLRSYPGWIIGIHGQSWNVLDNLEEAEMVGGMSRTRAMAMLSEVAGLASAYPEGTDIPLEGEIRLSSTPPIQEVMMAYLPHLHPALRKAPQLFRDEHFTEAAREACLGLLDQLKVLSGRSEDTVDLVNRVFSSKTPILVIGDQATETGHNQQEGLGQALRGFVNGVRHPLFHGTGELPAQEAFEWLVTASRLCHQLDSCQRTS